MEISTWLNPTLNIIVLNLFLATANLTWLTPTLIISILTLLFGGGILIKFKDSIYAYVKKWSYLHQSIKKQKNQIENNEDFFGDLFFCHKIKSFNNNPPLYEKTDNGSNVISINKLPKSYLIIGAAGDGKSTLLQKDFIRSYKKSKKKCTLFYNASTLTEIFKKGIACYLGSIFKDIKVHEICLFIDGIDELGKNNLDNLNQFILSIDHYCSVLTIKVSSRKDFAERYKLETIIKKRNPNISLIEFGTWDKKILLQIANDVIAKARKNKIIKKEQQPSIWKKVWEDINDLSTTIVRNPLLLRLYLYIILSDEKFTLKQLSKDGKIKEYDLFNHFIDILLNKARSKKNIDGNKSNIALQTFKAYCNKNKTIETGAKIDCRLPLFKHVTDDLIVYVHERFYEFFVAFYYKEQLINNKINEKYIEALSKEYSKAYAAFITDAIRLESEATRDSIANMLIYLYRYTIKPNDDKAYMEVSSNSETLDETIKLLINQMSAQEILFLKDEIVYRLGRLHTSKYQTKIILRIFKFIYETDNYINGADDEWRDYWIAIYKRSCAISSSLLGGAEIECKYVKHMLDFEPYKSQFKTEYDLANRSHTLIYYGDEIQCDLLEFKDQPGHIWDNARNKRLERLKTDPREVLSLEYSSLNNEQKKILKAYRFRLFDLATIYCFLNARIYELHNYIDVLEVIKNCIVDFEVNNLIEKERIIIMKDIRNQITKLFD